MNILKNLLSCVFFIKLISFTSTCTQEKSSPIDHTARIIQCIEEILSLCNNTESIKEKYAKSITTLSSYYTALLEGKRVANLAEDIQFLNIIANKIIEKHTDTKDQEIKDEILILLSRLSEHAAELYSKKKNLNKNKTIRTSEIPNNAPIAIGYNALASHGSNNSNYGAVGIAIGSYASAAGGANCNATIGGAGGIAIGSKSTANGSNVYLSEGATGGIAIGNNAFSNPQGVALGNNTFAGTGSNNAALYALALGTNSQATASEAIIISSGQTGITNNTANSFLLSNNGGTGAATSGISFSDGLGSYFLNPLPSITGASDLTGKYVLVIDPDTGKISVVLVTAS